MYKQINTITWEITANIVPVEDIRSSEIVPIMYEVDNINPQALADYEAFVINVMGLIESMEFELKEFEKSTKSETSYYFAFYAKDNEGNLKTKFIFIMRLSDHRLDVDRGKNYRQELADKYKELPTKEGRQKWKLLNVVVNGKTFDSYDEALDMIDETFERIRR